MKTKSTLIYFSKSFTVAIVLCLTFNVDLSAQNIEMAENLYSPRNEINSSKGIEGFNHEGALAFINGEYLENNDGTLSKVFTVKISTSGSYFLSTFALGYYDVENNREGKKLGIVNVYIDEKMIDELDIRKNGWQSAITKRKGSIFLESGIHKIEFRTLKPYYPEIDAIKLSTTTENARFNLSKYQEFVSTLKEGMDKPKIPEKSEIFSFDGNVDNSRSASNETSDWTVSSYTLSNPLGNYQHRMTVPVTYTYYKKLNLSGGQTVTFETQVKVPLNCSAVDPVMYLFKEDDINHAWSNDDGGCDLQSYLSVNIPATGNYYLVLRAYNSAYSSTTQGYQGVVDIRQNGSLLQEDAVVGGYLSPNMPTSNTGTINYFTGYSTGLPMVWIAPGGSGTTAPIKFLGERFWSASPMSYTWDSDARVRFIKNSSGSMNSRMLVSSEGAWYVYWGNADIYGGVKQASSAVVNVFPNLYANDAMQTAPATNNYNCAAWAGGKTDAWVWHCLDQPTDPICGSNGTPNLWSTWADYFGNSPLRYSGATTYTTSQANANNAEIAAWSTNGSFSGLQHFSNRAEADQHPHGYDWESKPGGHERIFHPKNSLSGSSYGNIFAYYRDANKSPSVDYTRSKNATRFNKKYSFEESVALGLTEIVNVELSSKERDILESMKEGKSSENFQQFMKLFKNWLIACETNYPLHNSNFFTYFEDKAYMKLNEFYSQSSQDILPYYIDSLFNSLDNDLHSQLFIHAFCSLNKEIYGHLLVESKEDWSNNSYTDRGGYIAPTPKYITKQYCKKILVKDQSYDIKKTVYVLENSVNIFGVSPNPVSRGNDVKVKLTLHSGQVANIDILDITGKTIMTVGKNISTSYNEDIKQLEFSTSGLHSGIYICRAVIDRQVLTRKFLIE